MAPRDFPGAGDGQMGKLTYAAGDSTHPISVMDE